MPWQPFRRKNKYRHVGERGAEEETSFDTELLPRSVSDGNLVRCGAFYSSNFGWPEITNTYTFDTLVRWSQLSSIPVHQRFLVLSSNLS